MGKGLQIAADQRVHECVSYCVAAEVEGADGGESYAVNGI